MRTALALAELLLLAGCLSQTPPVQEAVIAPTVHFREDFSRGAGAWKVSTSGGATMGVVSVKALAADNSIEMLSSGLRGATAVSPEIRMDWGRPYDVSFDFMLLHRDNFGITVYRDPNVNLALAEATGLSCAGDGKRALIGRFETNKWTRVTVEVRPETGEYDVLLDGARKSACTIGGTQSKSFVVGDEDPSEQAYGDALWDNFLIESR
jgi:hypothetical protein